jgi:NADPH-dependent 2,4-dienoyl-CoA reductase/sulfur reductase-like enzyme
MSEPRIAIVGAGPAGVRAAAILADAGLSPILITEAPAAGGQIYRQPPAGFSRDLKSLYGFEAGKARALRDVFAAIRERIDWRPNTLVWNIWQSELHLSGNGGHTTLPFDRLILCTGATDRIIPLENWTLPGIYSLGGAQIALKAQGLSIGRRVVFLGTGPLLYLAAYQYAKAGIEVAAVLDTTNFATKARRTGGLARDPVTFAKGLFYIASLRRRGVRIVEGAEPLRFEGTGEVEGITIRAHGRRETIRCDAVGMGFGLRPETQLADLAGCRFTFDTIARQWLPERDGAGRTSVSGVLVAGDGAAIGGADVAEFAGERAAFGVLEDLGRDHDRSRTAMLDRRLAGSWRFRAALEAAFPFPVALARAVPDQTLVCRCEGIAAGALRDAVQRLGATELNRTKAFTRLGMGRCQGRLCGPVGAEIVAAALGSDISAVGRLRGQPPVKPFAVTAPVPADAAQ